MDKYSVALTIATICFVVFPFLVFRLFKLYNSADGERYRKRSMQGPFVPLSADEIAEDEARKAAAKSKGRV